MFKNPIVVNVVQAQISPNLGFMAKIFLAPPNGGARVKNTKIKRKTARNAVFQAKLLVHGRFHVLVYIPMVEDPGNVSLCL